MKAQVFAENLGFGLGCTLLSIPAICILAYSAATETPHN